MKPTVDILYAPVLSEKSSKMRFDRNHYVFKVALDANKIDIRRAVEGRFNVIVDSVTTMVHRGKLKNMRGIAGRKPAWKKAVVRIRQGDTIPEFEGA